MSKNTKCKVLNLDDYRKEKLYTCSKCGKRKTEKRGWFLGNGEFIYTNCKDKN